MYFCMYCMYIMYVCKHLCTVCIVYDVLKVCVCLLYLTILYGEDRYSLRYCDRFERRFEI